MILHHKLIAWTCKGLNPKGFSSHLGSQMHLHGFFFLFSLVTTRRMNRWGKHRLQRFCVMFSGIISLVLPAAYMLEGMPGGYKGVSGTQRCCITSFFLLVGFSWMEWLSTVHFPCQFLYLCLFSTSQGGYLLLWSGRVVNFTRLVAILEDCTL